MDKLIYCYDDDTKSVLLANDYILLKEGEEFSIFANNVKNPKLNFADYNKYIKFSNVMLF